MLSLVFLISLFGLAQAFTFGVVHSGNFTLSVSKNTWSRVAPPKGLTPFSAKRMNSQVKKPASANNTQQSKEVPSAPTVFSPKLKIQKRTIFRYPGKACRQSGSKIYFTYESKPCQLNNPDAKHNQWTCSDTDALQCAGLSCPYLVCDALGSEVKEDLSEFKNKKRPIHPIG